jgi:CheY-like chemotaxis protein
MNANLGMTAHSILGDREDCLAAGIDTYLSKPTKPEELYRTIAEWASPRNL